MQVSECVVSNYWLHLWLHVQGVGTACRGMLRLEGTCPLRQHKCSWLNRIDAVENQVSSDT